MFDGAVSCVWHGRIEGLTKCSWWFDSSIRCLFALLGMSLLVGVREAIDEPPERCRLFGLVALMDTCLIELRLHSPSCPDSLFGDSEKKSEARPERAAMTVTWPRDRFLSAKEDLMSSGQGDRKTTAENDAAGDERPEKRVLKEATGSDATPVLLLGIAEFNGAES